MNGKIQVLSRINQMYYYMSEVNFLFRFSTLMAPTIMNISVIFLLCNCVIIVTCFFRDTHLKTTFYLVSNLQVEKV